MSGAEVIGIISGTIAILDAVTKVYSAVIDASGLPPAFRDVARRLPLVQHTLQTAETHLNKYNPDEESYRAMKPTLEGCKDKAKRLEKIFQKVVPRDNTPTLERYFMAVRTVGKGDRVETLMKGMLEDVQLLTGNRAIEAATEAQVGELEKALKEVSTIPPSLPTDGSSPSITNFGPGPQNIHTGSGNQNNNTGSGQQFNGPFSGPFYISPPPPPQLP
jgi:hypothetical protein